MCAAPSKPAEVYYFHFSGFAQLLMRNLSPFLEDTHLFLSSPQTASITTLTLLLSPFSNPSLELSSAKLHASSSHWWTGGVPLNNFLLLLAHPSVAETRNLPAWPEILGPPHRRELDEFCFSNFYSFFALRLQAAVKERQICSRVPVSKPNKSLCMERNIKLLCPMVQSVRCRDRCWL